MSINDSPRLTLGQMAMDLYRRISEFMPDTMITLIGIRRVYGLVLQLDALLVTYRDKMSYIIYDRKQETAIVIDYYAKLNDLLDRKEKLNFNNSNQLEEWTAWVYEYLTLLSSCFNQIGLAPSQSGGVRIDDVTIKRRIDRRRRNIIPQTEDDTGSSEEI